MKNLKGIKIYLHVLQALHGKREEQSRAPSMHPALLFMDPDLFYCLIFRLNPTRPTIPEPSNSTEAGTGTGICFAVWT